VERGVGRAEGTAAEYVVLPTEQAVPLPEGTNLAAGACLGIPALTDYHAVTVDGVSKVKAFWWQAAPVP
jgi:NADPH2:quinone reductase